MRLLPTILLLVSISCFSQSDTAWLGEKIQRPIDYQVLANFDFENALKKDCELLSETRQGKAKELILSGELLCGGWQAEGLGNTWGGFPQTILKPNKQVVFTGDSIFFYRNDILARATHYRLVRPSPGSVCYTQTLVELSDLKEKWQIVFYQVGDNVPWHGTATKPFLLFNKEPNCVCGCPEELYSQEVSSRASSYYLEPYKWITETAQPPTAHWRIRRCDDYTISNKPLIIICPVTPNSVEHKKKFLR